MRIVASVMPRAAALFAVWLALDDNVSQPELFLGIGVALLATVAVLLSERVRSVRVSLRLRMLRRVYRPLTLLVTDSVRVTWALIQRIVLRRRVEGRLRAVQYRATSVDSDTDAARRVLSQWGASLAPNRYAVGVDVEAGVMIVHELVEASGPLDPMELG
jgi:multisubunit Na+/H+ antiporter MnhE subunit